MIRVDRICRCHPNMPKQIPDQKHIYINNKLLSSFEFDFAPVRSEKYTTIKK